MAFLEAWRAGERVGRAEASCRRLPHSQQRTPPPHGQRARGVWLGRRSLGAPRAAVPPPRKALGGGAAVERAGLEPRPRRSGARRVEAAPARGQLGLESDGPPWLLVDWEPAALLILARGCGLTVARCVRRWSR